MESFYLELASPLARFPLRVRRLVRPISIGLTLLAIAPLSCALTSQQEVVLFAGGASVLPGRSTLGQSRLPMILPSSGSMANNGALTLTTALDQAYPAAYFYMPAGAIAAASVAGFYYGTMSSTTAVTLFNNLYVSGTATIPASPTAFATTGPGAYTQTVATSFTAWTVPVGPLGINDEVQSHGLVTYNNSAGAKTLSLTYGAVGGGLAYGTVAPTTTVGTSFQAGFANAGSATRQSLTGSPGMVLAAFAANPGNGAQNSAGSLNLSAVLKIAVATDYEVLQNLEAERISAANN